MFTLTTTTTMHYLSYNHVNDPTVAMLAICEIQTSDAGDAIWTWARFLYTRLVRPIPTYIHVATVAMCSLVSCNSAGWYGIHVFFHRKSLWEEVRHWSHLAQPVGRHPGKLPERQVRATLLSFFLYAWVDLTLLSERLLRWSARWRSGSGPRIRGWQTSSARQVAFSPTAAPPATGQASSFAVCGHGRGRGRGRVPTISAVYVFFIKLMFEWLKHYTISTPSIDTVVSIIVISAAVL